MPSLDRDRMSSRLGIPRRPERLDELPHRPLVTLGAVAVCALLALAAAVAPHGSRLPVYLVVLLAGLVTANGWTRVIDLPSRKGTAVVAALAAVACATSVLLAPARAPLEWLPVALAVGVVGAFLHQLLRTDGRPRVVTSLSGSMLVIGLLASGACWVALPAYDHGHDATTAAAVALALAAAAEGVLWRAGAWGLLLPASALVGAAVGAVVLGLLGGSWLAGLVLGGVCAVVAFALRAVLAPLPQLTARRAQLVSATASVLACGAVVLLAARFVAAV